MQFEAASLGCTIQDMTIGESRATPGNGVPPQATEDAARVLVVEDPQVTFLRTVRTDGMRDKRTKCVRVKMTNTLTLKLSFRFPW